MSQYVTIVCARSVLRFVRAAATTLAAAFGAAMDRPPLAAAQGMPIEPAPVEMSPYAC